MKDLQLLHKELEEQRILKENKIIHDLHAIVQKYHQPKDLKQQEDLTQAILSNNLAYYCDLYQLPDLFLTVQQERNINDAEAIFEYIGMCSHFMADVPDYKREMIGKHFLSLYPQIKKFSVNNQLFSLDTTIGRIEYRLISDQCYHKNIELYNTLITSQRQQMCYYLSYLLSKEFSIGASLGMIKMYEFETPHCIGETQNEYWDATYNIIMNKENYQRITSFRPVQSLKYVDVMTLPETITLGDQQCYSLYIALSNELYDLKKQGISIK